MKKIFLFLVLTTVSINSFSQVGIFQHLNEIREDDNSDGSLEKIEGKSDYIYYVNDEDSTNSIYGYVLTPQLYCYMTVVKPLSSESLQTWVQTLNRKWVVIDDKKWSYYRSDGNILESELVSDKDETVLVFSIKKFKNK